jgi:hypothetical protein
MLVMAVIMVWAVWPTLRDAMKLGLEKIGLNITRTRVLTWSSPDPKAQGALLTFTGIEIGHRFVGIVTSQEAHVEAPKKTPKIILAGS